jgi:hypothetical protein
MAGAQVLEWSDLDSEIKTASLKDVGHLSLCGVLSLLMLHFSRLGPALASRSVSQATARDLTC